MVPECADAVFERAPDKILDSKPYDNPAKGVDDKDAGIRGPGSVCIQAQPD